MERSREREREFKRERGGEVERGGVRQIERWRERERGGGRQAQTHRHTDVQAHKHPRPHPVDFFVSAADWLESPLQLPSMDPLSFQQKVWLLTEGVCTSCCIPFCEFKREFKRE